MLFISSLYVLTVGCISQFPADNRSDNAAQNSTTAILVQSTCPTPENTTYSILRGESFTYSGVVPYSDINLIQVLILDDNNYENTFTVSVNPDKTFNFSIKDNITKEMFSGIYHIILKYPTTQDRFDLIVRNTTSERIINNDKWIHINSIGDRYLDEKMFTFSGATNLAVGDEILVAIHSSHFYPCPKLVDPNDLACGEGFHEVVKVVEGRCNVNSWSVDVNTSIYHFVINWDTKSEWYTLRVSIGDQNTQNNNAWDIAEFKVVEGLPPTVFRTIVTITETPSPLSSSIVLTNTTLVKSDVR
jgi:hypothetical protein